MINYLANQYYWFKNYQILSKFFREFESDKILLFGYPKSGNTWVRFLLYNYSNLLINPHITSTINYNELNKLQNNVMDRGTTFIPQEGFPFLYRTHKSYNRSYNLFNHKIFIHRNPLDTLVSAYYFYKHRRVPFGNEKQHIRKDLNNINFYIKYKINDWTAFFDTSIKYSDYNINYSDLRNDPFPIFSKLIKQLKWEYKDDIITKSITLSSFHNIKKMAEDENQNHGNGPKDGSFLGVFNRSGNDGQYKNELTKETINLVLERFQKFNDLYSSS